MQASDFKSKVKQIEREKAANTKKRMLLKENEHLQSTLRIRISRKEVLQDNEKEIEELQESISSISVKLLKMQTYQKATQTVLSSNGSICEAQDDYNDPVISFKKDELLQLSTNGHKELHSLRMPTSEQKLFVASCNVQALKLGDLTIKKGEVLEVVKYVEDGDWWYMHSLHTDNNGCVPVKYMIPIKGELSKMYYKYIYYHTVSRNEAKERLSQADTQAGTFLIRDSESNPRQHTLSLNDGFTIMHYQINSENNKYYINPHIQFNSLNDLVHHYMMKADGLTCSLKVPIPKQANIPIAINKEWEKKRISINLSKCTNVGHFGETWEGNCKGKGPVIVKTNVSANITQETFFQQANTLINLQHKNIISLYGVCTESYPFYIITESMNGNLKDYLTSYNPTPAELVDIAIQVTDGMMYLGEQDYIHCSLKAANILLGDHNTVKIANFHLAQHLNGNKYWTVEEGAKLAIRWPAPEFYTLKRLSIKSDVWSFGILLWEMVTKGDVYPGITTNEVRELVSKGDCIYIPRGCLEPFDQLMINCRKHKDYERPSFKNIFDVLIKYDTHDT
ncbi:PREDICTED: tyrosine-protein kinase SRK3-like isoform X2 [Amphimedon queenslandica]|uniref:Tyrosine-protein kinase n=1 Tax=Amphimedon queenslandica TaxID=400682 RepID=A0AAN0JR82_AMPQE|nr:PREDICTED: tyrosine-protein kinase SRK3-like isoform X2 [Amphimedon queenslandica]|eukprot:XP_019859580.1 PREDICTED: tyrosine-protein kinase SRK3-like isoform X2 [Amphimedon queenslandica]